MKNWNTLQADRVKLMQKHYTPGRGGHKIEMVVVHHNAGVLSIDQIWRVWQDRAASAHYQVTTTGEIGQLVWDKDTAWHAANQNINQRSIGIEFSNSAGSAQGWPIADKTIEQGGRLIAAVCKYYGLGRPVSGKNVRYHREFTTTSCPMHLAPGGKYNARLIGEAQRFYDELVGKKPHSKSGGDNRPVEKLLGYPRDQVRQDTAYNCGPASAQTVIRAAVGKLVPESSLGAQMGTGRGGTDWIGLIAPVLNRYMPTAGYKVMELPLDPPTATQKRDLWARVVGSIDAGYGLVANIVAPPSNYPRASYKSTTSLAYHGGTVYHYVAVMGYAVDGGGRRHVWLADSGFAPYGSWVTFDQFATLIPPKGIAYATARRATAGVVSDKNGGRSMTTLDTEVQSLVEGSDFKAPLGFFIRTADKQAFETHEVVRRLEEKLDRLTKLVEGK